MSQKFALTYSEITALSEAGNWAPSGGNAQPWVVAFTPTQMLISVDEKRSTSFLDAGRYATFLGIGCFVENVSQMADELGLVYIIVRHSFENFKKPLVEITFQERGKKKPHNLAAVIPSRCTNRQLSDGQILSSSQLQPLYELVAKEEKYKLQLVSRYQQKEKIALQLGKADGLRYLHPGLFAEMIGEFRFSQEEVMRTQDGLDIKTLEMPKNAPKMMELLATNPKLRLEIPQRAFEKFAKPLLMESSHLGCLAFSGKFTPQEMVKAGQVLERIWLQATASELAFQPWSIVPFLSIRVTHLDGEGFNSSQIQVVTQLNQNLKHLFGYKPSDSLAFIFRLSKAKAPTARSIRRPWQDYTTISFNAMM